MTDVGFSSIRSPLRRRRAAAAAILAVVGALAHLLAVAFGVPEARGPAITPGTAYWELFSWIAAIVRVLFPLAGAALLLTSRHQAGVAVLVATGVLAAPGLVDVFSPGLGPASPTGALWLVSVVALLATATAAWKLRERERWSKATPVSPVLAVAGLALVIGEALPRVAMTDWPALRPQLAVAGELETLARWGLTVAVTLVVVLMAAWLERPLAGAVLPVLVLPVLAARLYDLTQTIDGNLTMLPAGWLSLAASVVLLVLAVRWLARPHVPETD